MQTIVTDKPTGREWNFTMSDKEVYGVVYFFLRFFEKESGIPTTVTLVSLMDCAESKLLELNDRVPWLASIIMERRRLGASTSPSDLDSFLSVLRNAQSSDSSQGS